MRKQSKYIIVLCALVLPLFLVSHLYVTQTFDQFQKYWASLHTCTIVSSFTTETSASYETRIQTEKMNNNISTRDILMTKSRLDAIENMYGRSWDSKITTYQTRFLIDGKDICNVLPPPFLVVFILSMPNNTEERQAIRESWGSVFKGSNNYLYASARLMFMLGKIDGISLKYELRDESDKYKDIVQIDLIESRVNLTRKMMSGLKWIKTYCNSVTYMLKVDDDTFINAARFFHYLLKNPNIDKVTIHGWVYTIGTVMREGKYKVKNEEFPKPFFPLLTSGTAYILPYDVIPDMLDMAERVPYCPVDDAFMTGVLRTILGFKIQHSEDFTHVNESRIDSCRFYSKIAVTNISPTCMHLLWNLTTQYQNPDWKRKDLHDQKICPIFS